MRLENPLISPITGKLDQSQGLQTLGTRLYVKGAIALSGDWLAVECWFPSFALLDYRVTNQIYIYVTRKSSNANLSQSECLIRHCLISELALLDFRVGSAWFPSYIYINLIGHSVIKQCKTRKSTFYRESVPWQWIAYFEKCWNCKLPL